MKPARAERLYLQLMESGDSQEHFRALAQAIYEGNGLIPFMAISKAMGERRSVVASLAGICSVDEDPLVRSFGESLIVALRNDSKPKQARVCARPVVNASQRLDHERGPIMNSFQLGEGLVKRVRVPRCASCVEHGYVARDCGYCDGTGYYESCDCCANAVVKPFDVLYRVERPAESPFYVCNRAECRAQVFEELTSSMLDDCSDGVAA